MQSDPEAPWQNQKLTDAGETKHQKFIAQAKELGADGDEATFRSALKTVAKAPVSKPKKKS